MNYVDYQCCFRRSDLCCRGVDPDSSCAGCVHAGMDGSAVLPVDDWRDLMTAKQIDQAELLKIFPQLSAAKAAEPIRISTPKRDAKESLKTAWSIFSKEPWPFEPEFRFHTVRRWRFDWAIESIKLAVEVEGVTHYGDAIGRHQSADGIEGDMVKYNVGVLAGWAVLRYSQRMIKADPEGVVKQISEAIESRKVGHG